MLYRLLAARPYKQAELSKSRCQCRTISLSKDPTRDDKIFGVFLLRIFIYLFCVASCRPKGIVK